MYCNNWYMAVIGQLFGVAGLEQAAEERAFSWYNYNEVDILVFGKLADGIKEIVLPDEVKLGRIGPLTCFPVWPFRPCTRRLVPHSARYLHSLYAKPV